MPGKEEIKSTSKHKNIGKSSASEKSRYISSSKSPFSGSGAGNIIVVCRFRPLNQNELNHGGSNVWADFHPNKKSVIIETSGDGVVNKNEFTFDRVFDVNSNQVDVYNQAAKPIIESVMDGFNGTVFAYGQTGSGKTFTMQGLDIEDIECQGIVPRMVRTVFNRIENSSENIEFTVKVSMMEIYMEKIRDLLDPTKSNMQVKVDKNKGVFVHDLTERYIGSDIEVYDIMRIGNNNRKVASTSMNDQSSRSHSIFVMTIHQTNLDDQTSKTGILYLVDLAGSEKVGKTGASGHTLDEAKGINKSLSTLGKVINSLTDGKSKHVPYRESKLTRILSESLGGNARTALIITCSPSVYNDMETISTLRFGTAARNIKNKPKVNKELTVGEMKKLLNKSEKIIQVSRYRVQVLETCITDLGGEIPEDEYKDLKTAKEIKGPEEESKEPGKPEAEEPEEDEEEEKKAADDELQEKLKRLQEKLKIETDKYWNLSEEYEVSQNKLGAYQDKYDKIVLHNQKLEEELEEKNDTIDTQREKLLVHEEELRNVVESNEKLSKKIEKIEEMGGLYMPDMEDENPTQDKKKTAQEAMQKELIKVSQKLKRISELPDLSDQVKKILNIQTETKEEEKEGQENEFIFKDSILNIHEDLCDFKDKSLSLFLNEEDTNRLIKSQIELREQQKLDEKQKNEFLIQIDALSEELKNAVQESNPNIQAITKKLADEQIMKAENRWAEEKIQILRDLENRVSKVVQLEISLDEACEKYRRLENTINQGDVPLRKKISKLENQSEQLTIMYHQVVSEKSVLKVDLQVCDKKLKRKDEKIVNLEKALGKLKEGNVALKKILRGLKSLKMKANDENRILEGNNVTGIPSSGRVVKPLRGGRKEKTPRILSSNHSKLAF